MNKDFLIGGLFKYDRLVDLLSVATFGSGWLEIRTLKSERHLDDVFISEYLEGRCREERWLDRLLNGGRIICFDWYSAEDDDNGEPTRVEVDLNRLIEGLKLARDVEAIRQYANFVLEEDDYCDCNDLMQVVMFGEVIYG